MTILNVALPVVAAIADYVSARKSDVARQTGLSEDTVSKVSAAVTDYLTKDERAVAAIMAEIDKARLHDSASVGPAAPPLVQLLRGLVRPVITLTAFFWYVWARMTGIELGAEDYAIVGGIMAFWFGFRPFEKTGLVTPGRGK